ncbi:MAG TPA: hypothetical protein VMN36_00535 [Verrucomicrobiales bacterium]|nr:hypothetical protein [Verrucomicrobiales bacterium]
MHSLWVAVAVAAYGLGRMHLRQAPVTPGGETSVAGARPSLLGLGSEDLSASEAKPAHEKVPGEGAEDSPVEKLSSAALEALAREALSDPNPVKRNLAFSKLLEALTADNALAILESMEKGNADGDQWRLFRYAWGAVDGVGAMEHAASIESDRARRNMQTEVLSGWASEDPTDAMAWVANIEDPEQRERYQRSLIGGLADHDIGMATDYVLGLGEENNRRASGYLEMVAEEQLRKEGIEGGKYWAERLPEGNLKGAALERVAESYVHENPEAAAAWAQRYANVEYGAGMIEEVGDEWSERDPVAAVDWLTSLPEGRGKTEGMESAMGEWVRRDPLASSQFLAEMPASEVRDAAVSGFSRRLVYEDPEAAVIWAATIARDEMRLETLTRAGQAWYRRDAEAAATWLATSGLPPEAQESVLNTERNNRR